MISVVGNLFTFSELQPTYLPTYSTYTYLLTQTTDSLTTVLSLTYHFCIFLRCISCLAQIEFIDKKNCQKSFSEDFSYFRGGGGGLTTFFLHFLKFFFLNAQHLKNIVLKFEANRNKTNEDTALQVTAPLARLVYTLIFKEFFSQTTFLKSVNFITQNLLHRSF